MSEPARNFLALPAELSDPQTARYAVLPVPFEGTEWFESGTAGGPMAVIEASSQVEWHDEELGREFVQPGIATFGVVHPAPSVEGQIERVREAAGPIVQAGKFLLALGGEHSITAGLVPTVAAMHAPLSVLQIDAHADLRDTHDGTRYAHACVMRRVLEAADRICQVGVRSFSKEDTDGCGEQAARFITPRDAEDDPNWIDRAIRLLGPKVYVTVDVDGFDPSIAPGTGRPEPGGLTWRQVTGLLRRLCAERDVVAADITEVRPLPPGRATECLAARLACKIIAYTQAGGG